MSGHSHWAKVKRYKAVTDARRGRLWSKLARRIIVAAKHGGGDPAENLNLRYAIDEARAENMPNDTIDKAIKKGTESLTQASHKLAEIMYAQATAGQAGPGAGAAGGEAEGAPGKKKGDDDVVDADFEEVK